MSILTLPIILLQTAKEEKMLHRQGLPVATYGPISVHCAELLSSQSGGLREIESYYLVAEEMRDVTAINIDPSKLALPYIYLQLRRSQRHLEEQITEQWTITAEAIAIFEQGHPYYNPAASWQAYFEQKGKSERVARSNQSAWLQLQYHLVGIASCLRLLERKYPALVDLSSLAELPDVGFPPTSKDIIGRVTERPFEAIFTPNPSLVIGAEAIAGWGEFRCYPCSWDDNGAQGAYPLPLCAITLEEPGAPQIVVDVAGTMECDEVGIQQRISVSAFVLGKALNLVSIEAVHGRGYFETRRPQFLAAAQYGANIHQKILHHWRQTFDTWRQRYAEKGR